MLWFDCVELLIFGNFSGLGWVFRGFRFGICFCFLGGCGNLGDFGFLIFGGL